MIIDYDDYDHVPNCRMNHLAGLIGWVSRNGEKGMLDG